MIELTNKTFKNKLITNIKIALTISKLDIIYDFSLYSFSDEENAIMKNYAQRRFRVSDESMMTLDVTVL